jgi:hypothetical protein
LLTGVAVEKLPSPQNHRNLGDRKCLPKGRKSFVGLPKCKVFLASFERSSFSTPTGHFKLAPSVRPSAGVLSVMAIYQHLLESNGVGWSSSWMLVFRRRLELPRSELPVDKPDYLGQTVNRFDSYPPVSSPFG